MSKTISYKDNILKGTEHKLSLKTNNGKTGYKITKFVLLPDDVEAGSNEACVKIFNKSSASSIDTTINFSDSNLLAAAMFLRDQAVVATTSDVVIFDNKKFNQDIFVTYADGQGSATSINYYIELEAMPISDVEATSMTLQSIRNLLS